MSTTMSALWTTLLLLGLVQANGNPHGLTMCPTPEVAWNGVYSLGPESMNVTYACVNGYHAAGETYAECVNGQWSVSAPPCVAPGCKVLVALAKGYLTLSYRGAMAHFRCENGYTLQGPSVLVCDGVTWNGTQPGCHASDEHYGEGKFGLKSNMATGHHSRHHRNHHKSTHQALLEDSDYSCIEPATVVSPPSVANAVAATKWSVIGGIPRLYTVYRCKWGFSAVGEQKALYCQKGNWIGKMPRCVKQVSSSASPSLLQGDDPSVQLQSHEDWVRYADYTCFTENNQASTPYVEHALSVPKLKTLDGFPHLYVQYTCDPGYSRQHGNEYLYCKEKQWLGTLPMCVWDPTDSRIIPMCERNNGGCHQMCNMKNGQVSCSCRIGYRLGYDGFSCNDINECANENGGCEQLCFNTDGHFRCACKSGFYLAEDAHTCRQMRTRTAGHDRPPLVLFHKE